MGRFCGGSGVLSGLEAGGDTDNAASLEARAAAALIWEANRSIRALCSAMRSRSGLMLAADNRACQKWAKKALFVKRNAWVSRVGHQ